jgi:hypothetical protein
MDHHRDRYVGVVAKKHNKKLFLEAKDINNIILIHIRGNKKDILKIKTNI